MIKQIKNSLFICLSLTIIQTKNVLFICLSLIFKKKEFNSVTLNEYKGIVFFIIVLLKKIIKKHYE